MKTSEITIEANKLIKDIFHTLLKSDKKEDWKDCIEFIKIKVELYEVTRGEQMFIWKKTLSIMSNKYWNKFVKKKK